MSRVFASGAQNVDVASNGGLSSLSAFTYAAWCYLTSLPLDAPGYATISCKDPNGAYLQWGPENQTGLGQPFSLSASLFGTLTSATSFSAANTIVLNTWQRCVWTFDFNGDKKSHLYINGVEVVYDSQGTLSGSIATDTGGDLFVGNDEFGGFFSGALANFELWNVALTAGQVAADYAGSSILPGNLIDSLTFLTNQGSPEPDASGNNNTGVITGATFSASNPPPPGPLPPAPATVNPVSGIPGQTITNFTVTGTDFDAGGTSTLSFSGTGITVNSYGTRNATTLVANITIAGVVIRDARDVIVTNADTQTGTLPAAFTITVPSRCYNTGPASTQVSLPFSVTLLSTDNFDVPSPVILDTVVTLSVFSGTGALSGNITGTILAGQSTAIISGVVYNVAEAGVSFMATSVSGDTLAPFLNGSTITFTTPAPNPGAESGFPKAIMATGETTIQPPNTPFIGTLKNGGALIR